VEAPDGAAEVEASVADLEEAAGEALEDLVEGEDLVEAAAGQVGSVALRR